MVEEARVVALRVAERRLQAAQLSSDVKTLNELIDDRLIFTGPDGALYRKSDEIYAHGSGHQVMSRVDEEQITALVVGDTGITWFLGTVAGTLGGEPFEQRVRYTRTWTYDAKLGWRLVAGHVSAARD